MDGEWKQPFSIWFSKNLIYLSTNIRIVWNMIRKSYKIHKRHTHIHTHTLIYSKNFPFHLPHPTCRHKLWSFHFSSRKLFPRHSKIKLTHIISTHQHQATIFMKVFILKPGLLTEFIFPCFRFSSSETMAYLKWIEREEERKTLLFKRISNVIYLNYKPNIKLGNNGNFLFCCFCFGLCHKRIWKKKNNSGWSAMKSIEVDAEAEAEVARKIVFEK